MKFKIQNPIDLLIFAVDLDGYDLITMLHLTDNFTTLQHKLHAYITQESHYFTNTFKTVKGTEKQIS